MNNKEIINEIRTLICTEEPIISAYKVPDFINEYFDSKKEFAEWMGITPAQVSQYKNHLILKTKDGYKVVIEKKTISNLNKLGR